MWIKFTFDVNVPIEEPYGLQPQQRSKIHYSHTKGIPVIQLKM